MRAMRQKLMLPIAYSSNSANAFIGGGLPRLGVAVTLHPQAPHHSDSVVCHGQCHAILDIFFRVAALSADIDLHDYDGLPFKLGRPSLNQSIIKSILS